MTRKELIQQIFKKQSFLCVGLDTDISKIPECVKKLVDDGRMPGVPEDRWEKNIRKAFDMLFIASSEHLEATIEGVAEDGEQTWENVDGKVLPIDPKLRKTYIKKGWTYTHNED